MTSKKESEDAVSLLYKEYVEGDPEAELLYRVYKKNIELSDQLVEMRNASGLSQKELAKLVGTTQSAISRLENADYSGRSLNTVLKIAEALDYETNIRFYSKNNIAEIDKKDVVSVASKLKGKFTLNDLISEINKRKIKKSPIRKNRQIFTKKQKDQKYIVPSKIESSS
jgi:transcriptional regulator with XRE-family HTH domain